MTPSFTDSLLWRYATKAFDPSKAISEQELDSQLEALRLSPSSFGLQPWTFIVVKNPALRARIREVAWGQSQVTDASHLIVLCARRTIDAAYVKAFVDFIASERAMPRAQLEEYESMMTGFIASHSPEAKAEWMKRQVYIALGILLASCAEAHIDATPMEGFDPAKVDEILGLGEKNLASVVLCPIGYRSADDGYAALKKVRFPKGQMILEM